MSFSLRFRNRLVSFVYVTLRVTNDSKNYTISLQAITRLCILYFICWKLFSVQRAVSTIQEEEKKESSSRQLVVPSRVFWLIGIIVLNLSIQEPVTKFVDYIHCMRLAVTLLLYILSLCIRTLLHGRCRNIPWILQAGKWPRTLTNQNGCKSRWSQHRSNPASEGQLASNLFHLFASVITFHCWFPNSQLPPILVPTFAVTTYSRPFLSILYHWLTS